MRTCDNCKSEIKVIDLNYNEMEGGQVVNGHCYCDSKFPTYPKSIALVNLPDGEYCFKCIEDKVTKAFNEVNVFEVVDGTLRCYFMETKEEVNHMVDIITYSAPLLKILLPNFNSIETNVTSVDMRRAERDEK